MDWNGGMERWSGLLEWSTGLDYWSATPTYAQFGPTSMATNLIFKCYKAGWQRIDELKTLHDQLVMVIQNEAAIRDSHADLYPRLVLDL